jgi:hypothetical protein
MEVSSRVESLLFDVHTCKAEAEINDPTSRREAMASEQRQEWLKAEDSENRALSEKKVMNVVDIEPGMKILKSRYVYKIKRKFGKITRFKARLVAMGYGQEDSLELNFAPVVKPTTVRLCFALALQYDLHVHQVDISNAFCYAKMEGPPVYMHAPEGMDLPSGKCFLLLRSLYGLRTSPKAWNKTIDKSLKRLHYKPTISDPCLYYRRHNGTVHFILVYVDDILIFSADIAYISHVKQELLKEYEMTDAGEIDNFLNIRVNRDWKEREITLDQTHYCQQILEQYDFLVYGQKRKSPLPLDASKLLSIPDDDLSAEQIEFRDHFPYRQVVGALLYLGMYTRPNIAYAVGVLARFGAAPTYNACYCASHVLQYLARDPECRLVYSGDVNFDLHGFSDADWAGDLLTRRSTAGFAIFAKGGPLAWQSKLQLMVATSSLESEYMAMYAGISEMIWIRGIIKEIGLFEDLIDSPTPFLVDSQSAKDLASNPVYHKRSKHIDIKFHWLRQHVNPDVFNTIELHHCTTTEMVADIFTKSLTGVLFDRHSETISGKRKRSLETVMTTSKKLRNNKKKRVMYYRRK